MNKIALNFTSFLAVATFAVLVPGTAAASGSTVTYSGGSGIITATIVGVTSGESCGLRVGNQGTVVTGLVDATGSVQLVARANSGTYNVQAYCDNEEFPVRTVTVTGGNSGGGGGGGGGISNQRSNTGLEEMNPLQALLKVLSTLG